MLCMSACVVNGSNVLVHLLMMSRMPPICVKGSVEHANGSSKDRIVDFEEGVEPPVEISHYDSVASVTTVLSNRSEWSHDHDETDTFSSSTSSSASSYSIYENVSPLLAAQWQKLEDELAYRTRVFQEIQNDQNPRVGALLWEHEAKCRRMRRRQVLMEYFYGNNPVPQKYNVSIGGEEFWDCGVNDVAALLVEEKSPRPTFFKQLYDTLVFEVYTTLPTLSCIVLHCAYHTGLYEMVGGAFSAGQNVLLPDRDSPIQTDLFHVAAGLLAIFLMRACGDFYWWASDPDFKISKFHLHNQYHFSGIAARLIMFVKRRKRARALSFMLGYYILYNTINYFHARAIGMMGLTQDLLVDLPSKGSDLSNYYFDVVREGNNATFGGCRDLFVQFQNEARKLRMQDEAYTFRVLSQGSYEVYWASQNTGAPSRDLPEMMSPLTDWTLYIVTTVAGGCLLSVYGFPLWDKY